MSMKDLQRDIRKGEGMVFCEGTHRLDTLLSSAHDLIVKYQIRKGAKLALEIDLLFNGDRGKTFSALENTLGWAVFRGQYIEETEEASEMFNEDVYNLFNHLAPPGYCFGTHEGDGSCFGWWKCGEDW